MIIARSEYIVACPGRCNRHNTVTITNACVDVVGVGNCVFIRGQGRRSIFEVDRDAGLLGCAVIHKAFAAIQRDIQINGLLRNGEVCGTGVDRVEGFAGHCDDVVTGIRAVWCICHSRSRPAGHTGGGCALSRSGGAGR